MQAVLFFSLFIIVYVYAGYPALVFLFSKIKPRKVIRDSYQPCVTIIIAAYNEEEHIGLTLKNKLELNYPAEKREIIVISDGSTDRTDDIVKGFESDGVKLIRQEPRAGKTAGLNRAVQKAKGEIIIFSDANSIYDTDAVMYLAQNFRDPEVGYVTGKMIYTNEEGTVIGDGCSTYMKYENYLRKLETDLDSVVGVDGGIDAVRKHLYHPMNPDQLPDFVLPLSVVEQGFRVVYDSRALLKEPALSSSEDEYNMRVRVSLRALWAIHDMKHLLNIKAYKVFAWELFSHKVLRYLAFIFLVGAYVANMYLWGESIYFRTFFIFQSLFYSAAFLSYVLDKFGYKIKAFYMPFYFVLINLASAHAFFKFMAREKQVFWTPRKGN